MSIYTDKGYESREDYLDYLSEQYDVDQQTVYALADLLGSQEDFDGLVSGLDDIMY